MHRLEMPARVWDDLVHARLHGGPVPEGETAPYRLYGPLIASRNRVVAQVGQSLDGRVATACGDARDISGPEGLRHLHRLRALSHAVIVGSGTVVADDPLLTVREVDGPSPVRVVIDCRGDLTGKERLFREGGSPVLVLQGEDVPDRRLGDAEIVTLPSRPSGLDPQAILDVLAFRGLTRVLVEGGARTIQRFLAAGLVDRLHVSIAPLIIGSGPPGLVLPPITRLSEALRPETNTYLLGNDVLVDCILKP